MDPHPAAPQEARFLVDAHLDLAHGALEHGRNLRLPLDELRRREGARPAPGRATVTLPALQAAGVGLVFGTLFTQPADAAVTSLPHSTTYRSPAAAHQLAMAQLDYYHRLADELDYVRLVTDTSGLDEVIASHRPDAAGPRLVGIVPLMEGADPIREPAAVELWAERGLRLVGLAWDDTRYAAGAWRGGGGLTRDGEALLDQMAALGLIADVTHMSERACLDTLTRYPGPVVATHSNARSLVPGERQLNDRQISMLGERDGVIGIVLYNPFLRAGHRQGDPKERVSLDHVAAHIDHVCQVLGDARHVGIGSDFDGGFGAADIPAGLDSVADLPLVADRLQQRGYEPAHIADIMGGNWLRLLQRAWG